MLKRYWNIFDEPRGYRLTHAPANPQKARVAEPESPHEALALGRSTTSWLSA
jgi:hypothetical protein